MDRGRNLPLADPMMRRLLLPFAIAALCGAPATAEAADANLIAAAKKEGTVVWYTTQIVDQFARPAAMAFEKLYPGVRVSLSRTNATTLRCRSWCTTRRGQCRRASSQASAALPLSAQGAVRSRG